MSPGELAYLYRGWVRARPAREIMAAVGIAVGVALVFATVTANLSIGSSASKIIKGLAGTSQLQAIARSPEGVPEHTVELPGIAAFAETLQAPITISHGGRRVLTQIVGANAGIVTVNQQIANAPPSDGLVLPPNLASSLGVRRGTTVNITARGRAFKQTVRQVLGSEAIGSLASSRLAFGELGYVQQLLGLPGKISTVLAQVEPGKTTVAERAMRRAFEPAMEVTNSTGSALLLEEALKPQDQSTLLFVLLGVLVGILLIVTTTMLSLADRRRELAELRLQGFTPRQLGQIVFSQGLILGSIGSFAGIGAGWLLAVSVFRSNPDYLASAFPLGSGTVVSVPLLIAVWIGGVIITCGCVGWALFDLRAHVGLGRRASSRLAVTAGVLCAISLIVLTRAPLAAALFLAFALLAIVPAWLFASSRLAECPTRSRRLRWLTVAAGSIKAMPIRSVGLAATAAVGVFGATIAQGAHSDLLRGLETGYARYVDSTDIWITSPSDDLATNTFSAPGLIERLRHVPGVSAVRAYRGGWVDMAGRRVWLIARSSPRVSLPAGEIVRGDRIAAEDRMRRNGWVTISDQLARALHAGIGAPIIVPTPTGPRIFKVAATVTNLGWSSGVLFMAPRDYLRSWGSTGLTALEVDGRPAISELRKIAGPGLAVQTSHQRASIADALPRQGLERLSQIAWLLVVAATLAVALALTASVWQRRDQLASLRLQSFAARQIQIVLAWEAILVIGSGASIGALAGVYGHFAADRYLKISTGYPIIWGPDLPLVAGIVTLVGIMALLILAVPGRLAARAPFRLALDGR